MIRYIQFAKVMLLAGILAACGETGSTVGRYGRSANLPLYFTVAGARAGQGAVYRIDTLVEGGTSEPVLVASGLDFPTGLAMDSAGYIYVAEKLPAPLGKLKVIAPGADQATICAEGLHNPIAVAADTFNRIYVVEGDAGRIHKSNVKGELELFKSGLGSPRDIYIDGEDQIYVSELATGSVLHITPSGDSETLQSSLVRPFGVAADQNQGLYVLVNNTGAVDGQIVKVSAGTSEALVTDLTNPIGVTYDNAERLFFIEGEPANRVVAYTLATGELKVVAQTPVNPYALILTPY